MQTPKQRNLLALARLSMGWNHKAETANHTFKFQKQRITEGIMNTLVLLILVIASSLAAVKQRALQSKPSPAKMMNAMLFLLWIKHCMHIPQVNIHRKRRQLCLCLKETKGGSFGSNARLLSLGIIFTGCSCRWWNIHLSSAKNFSNNPVLMSAQGPGRIQPNLN